MDFQPLPPSFLYGALSSMVIYRVVYSLSQKLVQTSLAPQSFQQRLASLELIPRHKFHTLLPSTTHALLQLLGTYHTVFYGSRHPLSFDTRLIVPYGITSLGPTFFMGYFVGYLISDTYMSPSFKSLGLPYTLHHVSASIAWTVGTSLRIVQPLMIFLQFNELSTIVMNVRQALLTAGYTSSDAIVAMVSLIFFLLFTIVRVVPLPFVVYNWISSEFGIIQEKVGLSGALLVSMFLALNVVLQGSWFLMMAGKVVDALVGKDKKKKKV